ncbi:MAG: hypothetical protein A2583_09460 [Bdellovibrionales bacterium RIFOXYD1_FULL_53_11]|nr:MAG: hypothetical protein A2583_09460 [Bdellovibrionales bacterium RIFOXYD1_FULL_53_11]
MDGGRPDYAGLIPLETKERRKRRREWIAIALLAILFGVLTFLEFRLTKLSSSLPFVNSIFFFGLLNLNIVILIVLLWLVIRNIGKLFIERRRNVLGSRLKTKLVIAFFSFSIIPTLVLFVISAMYINSSFDKWFSIKVQNTLQASLEITNTYYLNAEENAMHFAEHLSRQIGARLGVRPVTAPAWIEKFLAGQRELLALDAVEYYSDPIDERVLAQRAGGPPVEYPHLPLDKLTQAFNGEKVSVVHHVGSGDMIRCLVPVRARTDRSISGVVVVSKYIPVSLVNKVGEIASVFVDYKDTNPLKYPMKTAYFLILLMITLVIIFVAIWIGLYMARELTDPVERLVHGAQEVGAGNLDVLIKSTGRDEIAVLVESFNNMTRDLRDNRARLTKATADLEKRRMQLEAVLTNVGTGVIVVESSGEITTFNRAVAQLLDVPESMACRRPYEQVLVGEAEPVSRVVRQALTSFRPAQVSSEDIPNVLQWNFRAGEQVRALAAVATPLVDASDPSPWGVVVVIDDMTHLIKGQREMAWREVARRIAHEIKNPLTPIKLSAQRLQRRLSHYSEREGALLKECTDTIIKHTDELKEMVNEFSNFARFPEASPAPHNLNDTLKETLTLYEQAHTSIGFRFHPEQRLPVFEFDRDQIKRVAINLLDNAVTALQSTPQGRPRQISIETHYNEHLQIAVIVMKDSGPGMAEDVKGRVFEPYFSTKKGGTGLGLAIAKRIINDHDGFIRIQSAPGEGTQFTIELPTAVRHQVDLVQQQKVE